MVKRYYGGILSATKPSTSQSSASGIWGTQDASQATQSGNWPLAGIVSSVEYLVVAGGGGGASYYTYSGGGGAGGLLSGTASVSSGISYTIKIGRAHV